MVSAYPPPAPLSANALRIMEKRYLKRNAAGMVVEGPQDLFRRVAENVAAADAKFDPKADIGAVAGAFYHLMASLEFLPNSPTLMNAGRELQQLSACFVLPIEDTLESIFSTIKNAALIQKSGGGTGFSFSRLRPKNDRVRTTSGCASGPVSFMKVFNAATEAVKQGGTRRGANMAVLRVDHPDILEFIESKRRENELNNFNISVAVTDLFMQALENNGDYPLVNPRTRAETGRLNANEVFTRIAHNAWQTGEPGIIFIDRINARHPTPALGDIESTNPCGEQPLLPYESCNLGSVNAAVLAVTAGGKAEIDYARLRRIVRTAVHFLDNVIEVSAFPLPEIAAITKANRKIGLGVMGFADLLLRLNIPYDSEPALQAGEALMAFIRAEARQMSHELALQRGPFPEFGRSRLANGPSLRNATTTTVAPTGTISLIANVSSGIEPLYAVSYIRHVLDRDHLPEINPLFEKTARQRGFFSEALMTEISQKGSLRSIPSLPGDIRKLFVTSHDIDPLWHVCMQAAFQRHTDNAVSKTVNLPAEATPADVSAVFTEAYRLGCNGVTTYRDASRAGQVLTLSPPALSGGAGTAGNPCPECGAAMEHQEGCGVCKNCGFSRCV